MIQLNKNKRFNFFEKKQVEKQLKTQLKAENYPHIISQYKFLKLFSKQFYFVGNIRNVKTVFLISYNTKKSYLWPSKKQYPFNVLKEGRMNIMARFIPVILIFVVLSFVLAYLAITYHLTQQHLTLLQYLIMFCVMPMAFLGIGSKYNKASSDAALEYAFTQLATMTKEQKNRIGFIFCDTTAKITLMRAIADFLKKANKAPQIIELDNIASENEVGIASMRRHTKLATILAKKYKIKLFILPELEENKVYDKYLMIATGKVDKDGDLMNKYTLKEKDDKIHLSYAKVQDVLNYFIEE